MKTVLFLAKVFFSSVIFLLNAAQITAQTYPELPVLNWEQRSDWLNVKALPASVNGGVSAKGNGTHDDTQAIQAAFDEVRREGSTFSTVYLPEGTYRITSEIYPKHPRHNAAMHLRGHGRNTKIVWHGPTGGRMFRSDSGAFSTYIGVVWDGRNVAAHGFIHHSSQDGRRESKVLHKHNAYMNFTEQGTGTARFKTPNQSLPGYNQRYLAESGWLNCLFINCGKGLALWDANDFIITIDGCEFYDNGYGIHCGRGQGGSGNFYVRNSHFERSKQSDMFNEHLTYGSSARRVTSVGSRAFYERNGDSSPQFTMQDCHISAWTNTSYAVSASNGSIKSPLLIFDCTFTNPPSSDPPVNLGSATVLVHSNNVWPSGRALVGGNTQFVQEIPKGTRGASITSANQKFFSSTAKIPGKVFDAKRDFGARGNGTGDDSDAIQKTIDAARAHGKGAIAYIPRGRYNITTTINITGGNYYVGGSGEAFTQIYWRNTNSIGPTFLITDPQQITIEHIGFWGNINLFAQLCAMRIIGTNSNPSNIHIEHVFVESPNRNLPTTNYGDVEVKNLAKGSVMTVYSLRTRPFKHGQIVFDNCSDAIIMLNFAEGNIGVKGKTAGRTGFLGVLMHCGNYLIEDNQSIVTSDPNTEQAEYQFVLMRGAAGLPAGRVTVSAARIHNWGVNKVGWTDDFIIENYRGTLNVVGTMSNSPGEPASVYKFVHTGTNPLNVVCMANIYFDSAPTFSVESHVQKSVISNWLQPLYGNGTIKTPTFLKNDTHTNSMLHASQALDHFRELGAYDLGINHGIGVITSIPKCVDKSLSAVSIYPGVTSDMVYFNGLTDNSRVMLVDMMGRSLMVKEASELMDGISLQPYANGLYMIKIIQGQEIIQSLKVLKK
jgi:hypothetical protein